MNSGTVYKAIKVICSPATLVSTPCNEWDFMVQIHKSHGKILVHIEWWHKTVAADFSAATVGFVNLVFHHSHWTTERSKDG